MSDVIQRPKRAQRTVCGSVATCYGRLATSLGGVRGAAAWRAENSIGTGSEYVVGDDGRSSQFLKRTAFTGRRVFALRKTTADGDNLRRAHCYRWRLVRQRFMLLQQKVLFPPNNWRSRKRGGRQNATLPPQQEQVDERTQQEFSHPTGFRQSQQRDCCRHRIGRGNDPARACR